MKIHSTTSLITNSSTTIFTNYSYSKEPFVKLVDEILVLMGVDNKCEDIFTITFLSDYLHDRVLDDICDGYIKNCSKQEFQDLWKDIENGSKIPEWLLEFNEKFDDKGGHVVISANAPEYAPLARLLKEFLTAPKPEEKYC